MKIHPQFNQAIAQVEHNILNLSYPVENERWQSSDVKEKPGHEMREVFNTSFIVSLNHETLTFYRNDIRPNLPWADNHFEERVMGQPLNPGHEWKNWPYANSADEFRSGDGGTFSHTYMERYWPKEAGKITAHGGEWNNGHGIRYLLGDLGDVVEHLIKHPESRQAFLPVWFPEDTGVVHGERVPCTLGYHFMIRHGHLHMTYYIRSCDFTRHFRDDLYLSLRLQLWMLDHATNGIKPGLFVFHCASMHIFENDYQALQG